jgi:hypothetical protein
MNPYKNQDLKKFIESIPQDVVESKTKEQEEENQKVYDEFIEGLEKGICFLCKRGMNEFIPNKPCFHWFTYPKRIKKKFFKNYLINSIGFFRLDSYFRWLANTEKLVGNINDLKMESSDNAYIETTYKYKNIEWAFSVGNTDLEGHANSKTGKAPHYHIQMKVDGNIFLKFNDYHIPFSDADLFNIEMLRQAPDKIKLGHSFGTGMSILEDKETFKMFDDAMSITDDPENASFNRQTIIQAPQGQLISGELIQKAMEESKITKEPIGKIMQRLMSDAKFTTVISPGDGIPKMAKRGGRK